MTMRTTRNVRNLMLAIAAAAATDGVGGRCTWSVPPVHQSESKITTTTLQNHNNNNYHVNSTNNFKYQQQQEQSPTPCTRRPSTNSPIPARDAFLTKQQQPNNPPSNHPPTQPHSHHPLKHTHTHTIHRTTLVSNKFRKILF